MANKSKYSELTILWESLYNSGKSFVEISNMFKCDPTVVRRRILNFTKTKSRGRFEKCSIKYSKQTYEKYVVKNGINECWGWLGPITSKGYGTFSIKGKRVLAHRFSYNINFTDPLSLIVCHKCDNPICSNPSHLFLGSYSDNHVDALKKGRRRTALSIETVMKIKVLLSTTNLTTKEISDNLNVRYENVRRIRKGESWTFL